MIRVKRLALPIAVLIAGLVMMAFGVMQGELQRIVQKAVIVCLECIGIG